MKTVPEHVPAVGRARAIKLPEPAERTLRNGLRVVVVRKTGVPRFQFRLRIPAGLVHDAGDGTRARLLPEVLLGGTERRDAVAIQQELQSLGASLSANADLDDLLVSGAALSQSLDGVLDLVADVLTAATFPQGEVAIARDRVAQEIIIALSQPQVAAAIALRRRLFGKHRYARAFPKPDVVRRAGAASLRSYHSARVLPRGSTLVIVGDVRPDQVLDRVERALGGWKGARPEPAAPPPAPPTGLPTLIVDRPGAVQTNIRIAGAAVPRGHADWYKLALANMVFGGYFSSRLVKNIREDKGYTYSPASIVDHRRMASTLTVIADVGTDVSAPSLVEIGYELSRMASLPVPQAELDAARRYLSGVTMLQIESQAGLASTLDSLIAAGLDIGYLREVRARLEDVTIDDVLEASARYLAPPRLTTVLVGDANAIRGRVESLSPVEVAAPDR